MRGEYRMGKRANLKQRERGRRGLLRAGLGLCMALVLPMDAMAAVQAGEANAMSAAGSQEVESRTAAAVDEAVNRANAAAADTASTSNGSRVTTASNALAKAAPILRAPATGDLWDGWTGDLSFLDGTSGDGSKEKPYQIATKSELMGLSELAAKGMVIADGEGTWPGDYTGAYFELTKNIDLGGIQWMPIGFYRTQAELDAGIVTPFVGHFDGNGKTVSNFRLYQPEWSDAGLFGAVKDSEIVNLKVKPGTVLTAKERLGLLAGSAENTVIRDITVAGTLKSTGTAGGVVGAVSSGSIVENCTADHLALDAGTAKESYIGGIAGSAAASLILDSTVNTGDTKSARIQGGGYVGGVVGFQNDTDIFNSHVMGTIGGTGSQSAGGVTGKYVSGKLKVARFEGEIAGTGLGSAAREGTFIGTHDTGFHFRYGTGDGADLAYLFADQEEKIAAGICGCGIPEDNTFTYGDHIGFWHGGDNFYTLIQGRNSRAEEERYFYEELEDGMLHVIDTEESAQEFLCAPDHFAPNSVGRPVRGYLVSVLQVDTAANVKNYYDVAALTARGESVYSHTLDKSHRGAVAAGDVVTVTTAPKNTDEEKYQLDGAPTYTDSIGRRRKTTYQTGGTYKFTMPAHDTEVSAVYQKVAASVRTVPEEFAFHVVQERTGNRKNPSTVTEVRDQAGKLIARYIDGTLEEGTEVQDVRIQAVVDQNNDVADESVKWSIDDGELILLKRNSDEDTEGYTKKDASLELNLRAGFFTDIIDQCEKQQAAENYQYPIADTIYGAGTKGGLAVLTASTKPAASFHEKPLTANCRIPVTFQIKDRTKVAAEGSIFDKTEMDFTVTRRLSGDRREPGETITVTAPQTLTATFSPDYFDKKDISWKTDDASILSLTAGGYAGGESDQDYKNASVAVRKDAKWIQDIMTADDLAHEQDPYMERKGSGSRTAAVTVEANDLLGNRQTASCKVNVRFVTVDATVVLPEGIELVPDTLKFDIVLTKTGSRARPTLTWSGIDARTIQASVFPELSEEKVVLSSNPELLTVDENGGVTPVTDAEWITEAMKKYPYTAEKTAFLTAKAGDVTRAMAVDMTFKLVNQTRSSSGGSGSGSSGGRITVTGAANVNGSSAGSKSADQATAGSTAGVWEKLKNGRWRFLTEGKANVNAWAWIYNPYAVEGQKSTDWFRFDTEGLMHTGWYQNPDTKDWYYLHTETDGSQGHMYTGWHTIGGRSYYFESDGRMATGWNWIDGRRYYLDEQDGYLHTNGQTPDGKQVDESGAWTVNGIVQTLGKNIQ